eukprot:Sspe_Gene.29695::Locus_14253_Transcript_1_1_Confidence_1.000_Length_1247::g.29695::m.29695
MEVVTEKCRHLLRLFAKGLMDALPQAVPFKPNRWTYERASKEIPLACERVTKVWLFATRKESSEAIKTLETLEDLCPEWEGCLFDGFKAERMSLCYQLLTCLKKMGPTRVWSRSDYWWAAESLGRDLANHLRTAAAKVEPLTTPCTPNRWSNRVVVESVKQCNEWVEELMRSKHQGCECLLRLHKLIDGEFNKNIGWGLNLVQWVETEYKGFSEVIALMASLEGALLGYTSEEKVEEKVQANEKTPEVFLCPLSLDIMTDPVTCLEGHTFDKGSIMAALEKRHVCPIDNSTPLTPEQLIPNRQLKYVIEQWKAGHL